MAEPLPPYDTSVYPGIWDCPDGAVDPRHLYWLADVLAAGVFRTALEIGSFLGTSATAFVEAVNAGRLEHATFCDLEPRENLRRVLASCRDPTRLTLQPGRSTDLLARGARFDFVFVDGDHGLATVAAEVERLLAWRPVCVMAHDTGVQVAGFSGCEGPPYLKWRFQTTPGYFCLEDNVVRPGERTFRGMFLATTSRGGGWRWPARRSAAAAPWARRGLSPRGKLENGKTIE